jgi:hypothetical protein
VVGAENQRFIRLVLAYISWPLFSKRSAMRSDISTANTSVSQITHSVNQCLGRLLQKRQLDEAAHDDLAAARGMLEALPLSTDEFALACRRLQNARHYLRYTEPGAAWYELRLLSGSLGLEHHEAREPRRRLRTKA